MKKLFIGIGAVLLFTGTVGMANAMLMNGGFETGDASYWDTGGPLYINAYPVGSPAFPDSTMPTEGSYFAQIVNGFAGGDGAGGISVAAIESGLGLTSGFFSSYGATEGSFIAQTFDVNAGDIISFDYNFLTNEWTPDGEFDDFAFVSLVDTLSVTGVIASTYSSPFYPSTIGGYIEMLGNNTLSFVSPFSGTVTLGFAVLDVGDAGVNSALYIDNITVGPEPVPEPSTMLLIGAGLVGLIGYGRKRSKK